ncbi:hypothetical protein CRUP_011253 [Coryphaenoides rupestris]|nr:hypothetical protein CRUP_011253 [Coryphaenoides rupestris]
MREEEEEEEVERMREEEQEKAVHAGGRGVDCGGRGASRRWAELRLRRAGQFTQRCGNLATSVPAGSLSIAKPLDREDEDTFNLTVVAKDHGKPQRSSSQLLRVHVIDVNDEAPRFQEVQYDVEVPENRPPGTSVLQVSAVDLDQGESPRTRFTLRSVNP